MKIEIGDFYSFLKLTVNDVYTARKNPIAYLRKHLRARPLNYNRMGSVSQHKWDGWKYYVTPKGRFMTGHLPEVLRLLEKGGYKIARAVDKRTRQISVWKTRLRGHEFRGYQLQGTFDFLSNTVHIAGKDYVFHRGIWDQATNAGKSYGFLSLIRCLPHVKILFIATKIEVFKAVRKVLIEHGIEFSIINDRKKSFGQVTLAMQLSLENYITQSKNAYLRASQIELVVCDEIHHAGSKGYRNVLEKMKIPNVLGMSGTPLDNKDQTKNRQISGLTGDVISVVESLYLIEQGHSDDLEIIFIKVPAGLTTDYEYSLNTNYLMNRAIWNEIVTILRTEVSAQCLIVFDQTWHGRELFKFLSTHPLLRDFKDSMDYVYGNDPQREKKLRRFEDGELSVLLASLLIQEGGSYPNIKCQIQYYGGNSKIRVDQTTGRASRRSNIEQDEPCKVFEFWPVDKSYSETHAKNRLGFYQDKGYKIEVRELPKKSK